LLAEQKSEAANVVMPRGTGCKPGKLGGRKQRVAWLMGNSTIAQPRAKLRKKAFDQRAR